MSRPKLAQSFPPLPPCIDRTPGMSSGTVSAYYPPIRCGPTILSPCIANLLDCIVLVLRVHNKPFYSTYDFEGQNVILLKKCPKSNFFDCDGRCFGFSAPKIGGVLMKTFSKGSFTRFFQKMAPPGGGGVTRFHLTWH